MLDLSLQKWALKSFIQVNGLKPIFNVFGNYKSLIRVKLSYPLYLGKDDYILCGYLLVCSVDGTIITTKKLYQNWEYIYYCPANLFTLKFRPISRYLATMTFYVREYVDPINQILPEDLTALAL